MTRFGPAGNSESFYEQGGKSTVEAPAYLHRLGLTAYEYQCGRGVRISDELARRMREESELYGIEISVHAPYYISLSAPQEEKRLASISYILQSAKAVTAMGGTRIVVHPGGTAKRKRQDAMDTASRTLFEAWQALDEAGLGNIHICIETMGRPGQLGTLEEVLDLCLTDERMLPCIDFGHLNSRSYGGFKTFDDYRHVFDLMENALGAERIRKFHCHFSKIEYSVPGGEKKHLTFADTRYGPEFEPVAELILHKGCNPVLICESSGTQAEDAAVMKDIYEKLLTAGPLCAVGMPEKTE